jgi:hypothetical protein
VVTLLPEINKQKLDVSSEGLSSTKKTKRKPSIRFALAVQVQLRARRHGVQSGIFVLPQFVNNFVYLFDFKWFNSQKAKGKMFILY